jgi:hypothetical protein
MSGILRLPQKRHTDGVKKEFARGSTRITTAVTYIVGKALDSNLGPEV